MPVCRINYSALVKFLLEPHVAGLKCSLVEIREYSGIGGEIEGQFVGIQKLPLVRAVFAVLLVTAVFSVAEQRSAVKGEMRAYLVRSAR